MHKDEYEKLLKRFALELFEVDVSKELIELVEAQFNRTPNVISAGAEDCTGHFIYQHAGYKLEVKRTVSLSVRKCKQNNDR